MTAPSKPLHDELRRLWPDEIRAPHFQATIFTSGKAARNALQAAKDLELRGFAVQLFEAGSARSINAAQVTEAARVSDRIIAADSRSGAKALGPVIAKLLPKSGSRTHVIPLNKHSLTPGHIVEACLRNLDLSA